MNISRRKIKQDQYTNQHSDKSQYPLTKQTGEHEHNSKIGSEGNRIS